MYGISIKYHWVLQPIAKQQRGEGEVTTVEPLVCQVKIRQWQTGSAPLPPWGPAWRPGIPHRPWSPGWGHLLLIREKTRWGREGVRESAPLDGASPGRTPTCSSPNAHGRGRVMSPYYTTVLLESPSNYFPFDRVKGLISRSRIRRGRAGGVPAEVQGALGEHVCPKHCSQTSVPSPSSSTPCHQRGAPLAGLRLRRSS